MSKPCPYCGEEIHDISREVRVCGLLLCYHLSGRGLAYLGFPEDHESTGFDNPVMGAAISLIRSFRDRLSVGVRPAGAFRWFPPRLC